MTEHEGADDVTEAAEAGVAEADVAEGREQPGPTLEAPAPDSLAGGAEPTPVADPTGAGAGLRPSVWQKSIT